MKTNIETLKRFKYPMDETEQAIHFQDLSDFEAELRELFSDFPCNYCEGHDILCISLPNVCSKVEKMKSWGYRAEELLGSDKEYSDAGLESGSSQAGGNRSGDMRGTAESSSIKKEGLEGDSSTKKNDLKNYVFPDLLNEERGES